MKMLTGEVWKPGNSMKKVLNELMQMILKPDKDHPADAVICDEFMHRNDQFMKNATVHTRQNAMRR